MRPLNATDDLDATHDRVWGIVTATQAYDDPYQGRCGSVDEDASYAGQSRPVAQAGCPLGPSRGASQ